MTIPECIKEKYVHCDYSRKQKGVDGGFGNLYKKRQT